MLRKICYVMVCSHHLLPYSQCSAYELQDSDDDYRTVGMMDDARNAAAYYIPVMSLLFA